MKSLNRVQLLGNLGKDPEVRTLDNGTYVANFSIATTDYAGKNKETGEAVYVTDWHRCTAWGKLAEIIGLHCKKGSKLFVEAKLKYRSYDKNGTTVYVTDLVVTDFTFAGGEVSRNHTTQMESTQTEHNPNLNSDKDDLPF